MLQTNCEFLRCEIMDVLRSFGAEGEDYTHYFSYSGGKFYNTVESRGVFYDFEDEFNPANDLEYKRYAKRFCKLAFYKVISGERGVTLPWGALTGIRPTKLAYSELEAGRDFKPLFEKMCVSTPNTALVEKILQSQKGIYNKNCGAAVFVSVPFCPTKCEYCSFVTAPVSAVKDYIESYICCLEREILSLKPYNIKPSSIYIGGGTPFVLSEEQLTRIYAAINAVFPDKCEYTVEAGRPDEFTPSKLKISKEFGVNRICVNPQSFNNSTLKAIGRKHTAEDTFKAYALAREVGFDINLDLIAGLAEETAADFADSLDKAISLGAENVTVHTLSLKSGAKLKERVKRLNISGISDMISLSRSRLEGAGYAPYYLYRQKYQAGGLENVGWCKNGKACLYNVCVMEEIADNVAVGANAISKRIFGGENRIERYASPKDVPTYISKCEEIIKKRNNLFGV